MNKLQSLFFFFKLTNEDIVGDPQSEERKSFKPPFLVSWFSSRMRILLRRWKTQFLDFDEDLEEVELDPETVEEMEDLEVQRRKVKGSSESWEAIQLTEST